MSKTFFPALASLGLIGSLTSLSAQTAEEIVKKFEQQKAEALTTYLEENPAAEDRAAALEALVGAYDALGNKEKRLELMRRQFEVMDKKDADAQSLVDMIEEITLAVKENEGKAAAQAYLDKAIQAVQEHPMADRLDPYLKQKVGAELSQLSKGEVMEISFTDLEGNEVDLAKMKGKVVLVDFWATWCGPCIQELPNVQEAYEKYHEKGFEIIGISLDDDRDKLENFLENNDMPWPQYFDGKGWQNEISTKFGINSIPATYLIGKDGKIAATDLRGSALGTAVDELLSQ